MFPLLFPSEGTPKTEGDRVKFTFVPLSRTGPARGPSLGGVSVVTLTPKGTEGNGPWGAWLWRGPARRPGRPGAGGAACGVRRKTQQRLGIAARQGS